MTHFTKVPVELLERIYRYLETTGDVHHFRRTCIAVRRVITRQLVYDRIMRSIISTSPQHRYEIALSRLLHLHAHIINNPDAQFGGQLLDSIEYECPKEHYCDQCLCDQRIQEVLARYQGLRVLQDEWVARRLDDAHLLTVHGTIQNDELVARYNFIGSNVENSSPSHYNSFNSDQRDCFHAAVTSIWLSSEVRWVIAQMDRTRQVASQPIIAIALKVCRAPSNCLGQPHVLRKERTQKLFLLFTSSEADEILCSF